MSKHQITIELEMSEASAEDTEGALRAIAEGMAVRACEDYGIQGYELGVPFGDGGYDGPFVISAERVRS